MFWLGVLVGAIGAWLLFSGTAVATLAWLARSAPEVPARRDGGKPWET